ATPDQVFAAMRAAREAQALWGARSIQDRLGALQRLSAILLENGDRIAAAITRSTGKPIVESYLSEWTPILGLTDYYVRNAARILQPERRKLGMLWQWPKRSSVIHYQPIGVVAVISPWNYPFCIPMGDIITALAAGCAVLLKPSEKTPAVGQLIAKLCQEADLPVWVLQGGGDVGAALIDAKPDKLIFTGGPETGARVMEAAAKHLIPVVMELGGKDPMLVLKDAHIENAASAAVWGCFTNSGQVCASVKRIYVDEKIADAFIARVLEKVQALRIGDPMDPATEIGSLIDAEQASGIEAQVQRALNEGARLAIGGKRPQGMSDAYFAPTVLTDVSQQMSIVQEEVFGPILPIIRCRDEGQMLAHANDSAFGLCASVFGQARIQELAAQLRVGTVILNDCTYTHGIAETPWGGRGRSGFGRIHGEEGLRECVTPLHIHRNHAPQRRSLWWFPYDAGLVALAKGAALLQAGKNPLQALGKLQAAGVLGRIRTMR
ncbi:MAG: aldehyde dehydrogenase family protein, partial [Chlamydiia bacterium]|nr:aldehyde dehydrogenase family protein [Chlamydiia bacterium]